MKGKVKFLDIFYSKIKVTLPHYPGGSGWFIFEYDDVSIQLSIGSHVDIIYNFSDRNCTLMNDFYSKYKNPINNKAFDILHDNYKALGCKISSYKVKNSKCILKVRADLFINLDISKRREETINTILNY